MWFGTHEGTVSLFSTSSTASRPGRCGSTTAWRSPGVAQNLDTNAINAAFAPEPFVSLDEESADLEEMTA